MSNFVDKRVICPFYKEVKLKNRYIVCEGVVKKSSLILAFYKTNEMNKHIEEYCCRDYKKCIVCNMLFKKYEEV